ncbi:gliding motility protein GldM [soil metagenome]
MASGKQSPRQKMIAMMYLVLTAMLALNVSKEILDAFVTVNNGLETTGVSFDKDIAQLYSKFDEKKSIDPLRVQKMWEKAQEAKKLSKEMGSYVEEMKKILLRESEGFKGKEEDTIKLENVEGKERYDVTTNILCGADENGQDGQAHILRQKLDAYKNAMMNLLPPADKVGMHLSIESKDPTDGGEFHTWEMKTFYHTPLAADITILSKIQDDVKAAEADIVSALLKNTDSDIIPFDTVAARVISTTNYVMMGEKYEADIFLAAFNKTLNPQILLGKFNPATGKMEGAYDSVHVANGMGKYFADASREGIFQYEGVINMTTPQGKVMQYPFQSEYIVARPALTVSAEKMKVMYAGLNNPISVSVPGVASEKMRVSCSNGVLVNKGNGQFIVQNPKAGECKITVTATMENGTDKNMGTNSFKVKNLPKPETSVSGCPAGGGRVKAAVLASALGITSVYPYTDFEDAKCRVASYHMEIYKDGIAIEDKDHQGNLFDDAMRTKLKALKPGSRVFITMIKTNGPDGLSKGNDLSFVIY